MPVDEISARLRARLQEEYGVDEAAILMDRPPGGWGDLVTNESLDAKFAAFEHKLMGAMDRGFRDQTWRLMTATIGAMSALVAAMAIFVAIVSSR